MLSRSLSQLLKIHRIDSARPNLLPNRPTSFNLMPYLRSLHAAAQFAPFVGDILLTQEFGGATGLFRLFWDGANLRTEAFTLAAGSFVPGQWEHVTFAPAGIKEIPPTDVPEPATLGLLGFGLAGLGFMRRRQKVNA